jgi:hypothetical protein
MWGRGGVAKGGGREGWESEKEGKGLGLRSGSNLGLGVEGVLPGPRGRRCSTQD